MATRSSARCPFTSLPASRRRRLFSMAVDVEAMLGGEPLEVGSRMPIAASGGQFAILLLARLDRKGETAAGAQRTPHAGEHRRQVTQIDEHVGGDHQIELGVAACEVFRQFDALELAVDVTVAGLGQHVGGQIHARQPARDRSQQRPAQTGAAPEVQDVERCRGEWRRTSWASSSGVR